MMPLLSAKMFVVIASEPAASGLQQTAPATTSRLVKLVWEHVNALPTATIDALSAAFGNFDRVVALGWLLGDILQ